MINTTITQDYLPEQMISASMCNQHCSAIAYSNAINNYLWLVLLAFVFLFLFWIAITWKDKFYLPLKSKVPELTEESYLGIASNFGFVAFVLLAIFFFLFMKGIELLVQT